MHNDLEKLISKSPNPKLIEDAFNFAKDAYKDRFRLSGENYIEHATRVALMLDKMNLDPVTVALGLLHDALDDIPDSIKKVQIKELGKKFGTEIGFLVERISKLGRIHYSLSVSTKEKKNITRDKIENLRKMFLALAGDLRVIIVELVSRLDGLNLLHYLPEERRRTSSLETLKIFVPVASRLGLSEIRRNLEDVSFSYLFPEKFKWVKENTKSQYEERERYLKKFIPHLEKILTKERVKFIDINYRAKSYWSTYKKLLKRNMNFDEIYDLIALRIITTDIETCYRVLGIIHKYFKPISERIKDYIAKPKLNGYRSLHTTVFSNEDKITEIQIRTEEMQKESEYGVCTHWAYKENIDLIKNKDYLELANKIPDFWKSFKISFFANKVFCFTPKGDIISLPKNSTPVDFAYAVHSAVGDHCEASKINGKIVSLDHILENGDVVEITTNKNKKPSKDWLRFIQTSLAKSHITKLTGEEKIGFRFPLPGFIRKKFIEMSEASQRKREEETRMKEVNIKQVHLAGQKGILTHIAKCCNPQPGDKVRAYIASNRAAVLHKTTCNILKDVYRKFPEKTVDASWE
jgi:GTP pyrophosphokinase